MDVISVKSHMLGLFESFFIALCLVSFFSTMKAFHAYAVLCENKQKKIKDDSKVCYKSGICNCGVFNAF